MKLHYGSPVYQKIVRRIGVGSTSSKACGSGTKSYSKWMIYWLIDWLWLNVTMKLQLYAMQLQLSAVYCEFLNLYIGVCLASTSFFLSSCSFSNALVFSWHVTPNCGRLSHPCRHPSFHYTTLHCHYFVSWGNTLNSAKIISQNGREGLAKTTGIRECRQRHLLYPLSGS